MKNRYLESVVTLKLAADKCIGCGMCAEVCPHEVFVVENRRTSIVDIDACMECGACARNCPVGALSVRVGVGCAAGIIAGRLLGGGPCCGNKEGCSRG